MQDNLTQSSLRCDDYRALCEPGDASYSDDGDLICRMCLAIRAHKASAAVAESTDPTSARNLYAAAAASTFLGGLTCVMAGIGHFFFIACPLAIVLGGATLMHLLTRPEARKNVGAGAIFVFAGSISGILLGLLGTGVGLLGLIAAAAA